MLIGIDYTAAARQRAGIGRYTREMITALLNMESAHEYAIFAATGGLEAGRWEQESERLRSSKAEHRGASNVRLCTLPISDDWLARLWHRLRLPIPVEAVTGPLDIFYSPDFVLPPTRRASRTMLTVHDLSFRRYPDTFVPSLRRYLERVVPRSISRADQVLADSAHTRSDIISLFDVSPDEVQVVYSGVDPRFQPEPKPRERERLQRRYGIGREPYILSVGTLQPRKNYVRLIRAFAQLGIGGHPDVHLAIAGGRGWLYEEIVTEGKRRRRVHLLGFVDEGDLPALYRNAALFVFPSLYEGFGLPVLEAMACGVPVVCSDTSSLPEVGGEAALLVDPLDIDALAEGMAQALEDVQGRREMISRGLAKAGQFTWQRAARQLLEAFDSLGDV